MCCGSGPGGSARASGEGVRGDIYEHLFASVTPLTTRNSKKGYLPCKLVTIQGVCTYRECMSNRESGMLSPRFGFFSPNMGQIRVEYGRFPPKQIIFEYYVNHFFKGVKYFPGDIRHFCHRNRGELQIMGCIM